DAGHAAPRPLRSDGGPLLHAARGEAAVVPAGLVRLHGVLPRLHTAVGARAAAGGDPARVHPGPLHRSIATTGGWPAPAGGPPRRGGAGDVAGLHLVRLPAGGGAVTGRRGVSALAGALALGAAALAIPATPAAASNDATVGRCVLCHPDVKVEFQKSIHSEE